MLQLLSTIIVVAALAGPVFSLAMPFDPIRGLVEVDVTINGTIKGSFGIDTGADHLYIDKKFAEDNGLPVGEGPPQRGVVGVDGFSEASTLVFRSLEIGDERLHNQYATVIDMAALIDDKRAGIPDGLIGYDLLQRFYVTVDYPNRTIDLQMSEPDFLKNQEYDIIPFKSIRHLILVDVTFDDTITVPMIMDYCASYVFVSESLAQRLGMDAAGQKKTTVDKIDIEDTILSQDVIVIRSDYTQLRKRLRDIEFEGILGASFLYRHKITVDYKRNRILRHK